MDHLSGSMLNHRNQQSHNLSQPQINNHYLLQTQQQLVVLNFEQFRQTVIQQSPQYRQKLNQMRTWTYERFIELRRQSGLPPLGTIQSGPLDPEIDQMCQWQAEQEAQIYLNNMVAAGYQRHIDRQQERQGNLTVVDPARIQAETPSNRSEPIVISDDEEEEHETSVTQPVVIVIEDKEEEQKESVVETSTTPKPQQPRRRRLPLWLRTAEKPGSWTALYPERLPQRARDAGKEEEEKKREAADQVYSKELTERQLKAPRQFERPAEPQQKRKAGGKKRKLEETVPPQEEQEQEVAPKPTTKKQKKNEGQVKKSVASAPLANHSPPRPAANPKTKSDGSEKLLNHNDNDDNGEELASLLYEGMNGKADAAACSEVKMKPQQSNSDGFDDLFEDDDAGVPHEEIMSDGFDPLFDDDEDELAESDGLDHLFEIDDNDGDKVSVQGLPPQGAESDGQDDLFDDNEDDKDEELVQGCSLEETEGRDPGDLSEDENDSDDEEEYEDEDDDNKDGDELEPLQSTSMNGGGFIHNKTWSAGKMNSFMAEETDEWGEYWRTQAPADYRFDSDGEVSEEE